MVGRAISVVIQLKKNCVASPLVWVKTSLVQLKHHLGALGWNLLLSHKFIYFYYVELEHHLGATFFCVIMKS